MDGVECILDGCHNGDSVRRFVEEAAAAQDGELWVIFGAGKEKAENLRDMCESVTKFADRIILVQSQHFKAMGKDSSAVVLLCCADNICRVHDTQRHISFEAIFHLRLINYYGAQQLTLLGER